MRILTEISTGNSVIVPYFDEMGKQIIVATPARHSVAFHFTSQWKHTASGDGDSDAVAVTHRNFERFVVQT